MAEVFAKRRCHQCDRKLDVREMCEVQTFYPEQRSSFWDQMCVVCSRSYCDFMSATYAQVQGGPQVYVHPL